MHLCAHALGAMCDLHHGLANVLMIDAILAWNYVPVPTKSNELAHVCGVADGGRASVGWLRALKQSLGIFGPLSRHGVTAEHLPRLEHIETWNICHQTNPHPCTAHDF